MGGYIEGDWPTKRRTGSILTFNSASSQDLHWGIHPQAYRFQGHCSTARKVPLRLQYRLYMKNATYRFWAGTSLVPKNISWKLGMADRITQWRIVLRSLLMYWYKHAASLVAGLSTVWIIWYSKVLGIFVQITGTVLSRHSRSVAVQYRYFSKVLRGCRSIKY